MRGRHAASRSSPLLRGLGGVLLVMLAALGVLATTGPLPPADGIAAPTTTTTSSSTSISLEATTTTLPESPHPTASLPTASDALITPTGVVVAILEQTASGFRVRTPCGNEEMVPGGTPVGPVEVVIDPGHGGDVDPGAPGANGLTEAEVNLAVSELVVAGLEARGFEAMLTRTADYATTLGMRAALADHVGAELMVSIHHNAPTHLIGDEPGTEVFVQSRSRDSQRLGGLLYDRVFSALSRFDVPWSYAPDAGVLEVLNTRGTDAYGMLRLPETTTALAELAYMSNPPEAELFATDEYRTVVAAAVVEAISAFLDTTESASEYDQEARVFNPQPGISGNVCEDPALY